MEILAIGNEERLKELQKRISDEHNLTTYNSLQNVKLSVKDQEKIDVIFDLNFDDDQSHLIHFDKMNKPVIVSAVKKQIAEAVHEFEEHVKACMIGFNALPTFINREKAEVSLLNDADEPRLNEVMSQLGWDYHLVKDRVGLVTPRVVFMIINEACYTLQEGTAGVEDIDLGMKLGTNYPKGPFEWADEIGIKDVYETLKAIYDDTQDERYKICPLLKTKYLKGEKFY